MSVVKEVDPLKVDYWERSLKKAFTLFENDPKKDSDVIRALETFSMGTETLPEMLRDKHEIILQLLKSIEEQLENLYNINQPIPTNRQKYKFHGLDDLHPIFERCDELHYKINVSFLQVYYARIFFGNSFNSYSLCTNPGYKTQKYKFLETSQDQLKQKLENLYAHLTNYNEQRNEWASGLIDFIEEEKERKKSEKQDEEMKSQPQENQLKRSVSEGPSETEDLTKKKISKILGSLCKKALSLGCFQ